MTRSFVAATLVVAISLALVQPIAAQDVSESDMDPSGQGAVALPGPVESPAVESAGGAFEPPPAYEPPGASTSGVEAPADDWTAQEPPAEPEAPEPASPYRADSYPDWYTDADAREGTPSTESPAVLSEATASGQAAAPSGEGGGTAAATPATPKPPSSWNPFNLGQATTMLNGLIGRRQEEQAEPAEAKPGFGESLATTMQTLQTAGRAWSYFQGLESRVDDQGRQDAFTSAEQRANLARERSPGLESLMPGPQPTEAWRQSAMAAVTGGKENPELLNDTDYVAWRDRVMSEYKPRTAMTAEERKREFSGAATLEDKLAVLEAANIWARGEGRVNEVKDPNGGVRWEDAKTYSPLDRRYWENLYVFGRTIYKFGVSDR